MKKQKQPIIKVNPKVHTSIKNRKIFKAKMFLITFGLVLVLLGCGAMFTFGTVTWNPEEGFSPGAQVTTWWHVLLITIGAFLAVGAIIAYGVICYKIFKSFYATQEKYLKSSDFKKAKEKALSIDIYKMKTANIKWYKKMCFITAEEKRQAIEEQKRWIKTCKENKEKINYAKPMA